MKVLILSASTGNGHMSAAHAVEQELQLRGHDAKTVDVLDHTGKAFRGWYRGGYEVLVRRKPQVWGHLYKSSDRKFFNYRFQTVLDNVFVRKMRSFVLHEKPDWIVCTHSLPQPALEKWRQRAQFRVAIVVTDLYPQLMWLRGNPDWFFVPGEWSKAILAQRYPKSVGRTTVSGIPINSVFSSASSKQDTRMKLGLDSAKQTILVTSGGIGGGPMASAIRSLLRDTLDCQIVAVCGRNEQALNRAREVAEQSGGGNRIRILAHVSSSEMADFMHASDLIVAKPGGITTFEALAVGLPFVVFKPFLIPGQEERNAEFLVESGIGVQVESANDLGSTVNRLLSSPERLHSMAQSALDNAKPNASAIIVETLASL